MLLHTSPDTHALPFQLDPAGTHNPLGVGTGPIQPGGTDACTAGISVHTSPGTLQVDPLCTWPTGHVHDGYAVEFKPLPQVAGLTTSRCSNRIYMRTYRAR
jgi:hypothetical protein